MEDINYLKQLLNHETIDNNYTSQVKIAKYLTLLSLNNHSYQEKDYQNQLSIIEDYLRKVNNLKVKIQLKRKPEEIDNLLNEIKKLTNKYQIVIDKYNKEKLNIINILDTKDSKDITMVVDKLTKEKIYKQENKAYYDSIRTRIINNSNNHYYLNDNMLCIDNDINITLDEFYDIFDYLLISDNYKPVYTNDNVNNSQKEFINNLILSITNDIPLEKEVIPLVLNNLPLLEIPNYETIDTSKFSIDNIKITDLYSLADTKNETVNENTAKWRKIHIPNNYLYHKIYEIIKKGMYYFKDDKFVLEHIDNNICDFKISITIPDMYDFLNININYLNELKDIKHM